MLDQQEPRGALRVEAAAVQLFLGSCSAFTRCREKSLLHAECTPTGICQANGERTHAYWQVTVTQRKREGERTGAQMGQKGLVPLVERVSDAD